MNPDPGLGGTANCEQALCKLCTKESLLAYFSLVLARCAHKGVTWPISDGGSVRCRDRNPMDTVLHAHVKAMLLAKSQEQRAAGLLAPVPLKGPGQHARQREKAPQQPAPPPVPQPAPQAAAAEPPLDLSAASTVNDEL